MFGIVVVLERIAGSRKVFGGVLEIGARSPKSSIAMP
jgi:hypothetical protein